MMHRCSSSHQGNNNMVGPCTCGLFHTQSNNSFSMLFSMPNHHKSFDETADMYPFATPSSVDCTLSLGTPSTRLSDQYNDHHHQRRSASNNCMSNFCSWDVLQTKNAHFSSEQAHKSHRGSNGNNNNNNLANNDPLLARRCANCDTTSTPLWRNGPRGPKSLCNACGIRFKKEERRATAANANGGINFNGGASGAIEQQQQDYGTASWVQSQKMQCYSPAANEFRFIQDSDRDSDTAIPFLSWRLNVTDRPGLVHDFTR